MTDERDDGRPLERLEVPVTRVGGGAEGGDRRARIAALAVVLFAVTIVAIALPGATRDGSARPSPEPSDLALATPPREGPPATARGTPIPPRAATTPAPLPSIASQPLDGAPRLAFYRRSGDDVEILAWAAGTDAITPVDTVEGAFAGFGTNEPSFMVAAPDGQSVFIQSFGSFDTRDPSPVALSSVARGRLWTGSTGEPGSAVWSEDSRWFVFGDAAGRWTVIDTSADPPALREVDLSAYGPDASAAPTANPDDSVVIPFTPVPGAISRDGRWIYGAIVDQFGGAPEPAVRVSTATGAAEPIDRIPSTGPEAPGNGQPAIGSGVFPPIDPASGRTVDVLRSLGNDEPLQVLEPDGSVAFAIQHEQDVQGAIWVGDGRLAVVESDRLAANLSVYLVRPDGSPEPDLFGVHDVASGGLVTDRDGYLIVAFAVEPGPSALLVMIRLEDGATSTLELARDDVQDVSAIGWLDPVLRRG